MQIQDMAVGQFTFTIKGSTGKVMAKDATAALRTANDAETSYVNIARYPTVNVKTLTSAAGSIRSLFNKEATRLGEYYVVPMALIPKFKAELDARIAEYEAEISKLILAAENGDMIRNLERENGELFSQIPKVPTAEQIRHDFGVEVTFEADLTSELVQGAMKLFTDQTREELVKEIEGQKEEIAKRMVNQANAKPMAELRDLIESVLVQAGKRGDDLKGVQWKSIVDKIQRVTEVMPAYNLTGDTTVAKLLEDARVRFSGLTKEVLKDNAQARDQAAIDAKAMSDALADLF